MNLNVAHTKRKYNSLIILISYIDIEVLVQTYKVNSSCSKLTVIVIYP